MSTHADLMKRRQQLSRAAKSLQAAKAHASTKNEVTSETAVRAALMASVVAAADLVPGKGGGKEGALLGASDQDLAKAKRLLTTVSGSGLAKKGALAGKIAPDLTKDAKLQDLLNKKRSKLQDTAAKGAGLDAKLGARFAQLAKVGVKMADNALDVLKGGAAAAKQDAQFSRILAKQISLLGSLDRLLVQLIQAARPS